MVIESFQKRFVMNMQLGQCFSRAKPFWTEKSQVLSGFFDFQKKPKAFKKSQNFKIWLKKSQIGNPGLRQQQHINVLEGTALTRFTTRVIIIWEILRLFCLKVVANYLFSKYRPLLNNSKMPARPVKYRPSGNPTHTICVRKKNEPSHAANKWHRIWKRRGWKQTPKSSFFLIWTKSQKIWIKNFRHFLTIWMKLYFLTVA